MVWQKLQKIRFKTTRSKNLTKPIITRIGYEVMTLYKDIKFFTLLFCTLFFTVNAKETANPKKNSENCKQEDKHFLRPHKAEYTVSLLEQTENISNVKGNVTVRILDSFGWTLEYHIKLKIFYDDNTEDTYESTLASFETDDHQSYRFTLKTSLNNEDISMIHGKAVIDEDGATVTYKTPSDNNVDIAENSLFPVHLLRTLLRAAKEKPTANTCNFFGYYNTEFTPLRMSTVMCAKEPLINVKGTTDIDFKKSYQMKVATYPVGDKQVMDPISTLSKVIQADGITVSEDLFFPDFGFTIKTQLSKVDLYKQDPEDNSCSRSSAG